MEPPIQHVESRNAKLKVTSLRILTHATGRKRGKEVYILMTRRKDMNEEISTRHNKNFLQKL